MVGGCNYRERSGYVQQSAAEVEGTQGSNERSTGRRRPHFKFRRYALRLDHQEFLLTPHPFVHSLLFFIASPLLDNCERIEDRSALTTYASDFFPFRPFVLQRSALAQVRGTRTPSYSIIRIILHTFGAALARMHLVFVLADAGAP